MRKTDEYRKANETAFPSCKQIITTPPIFQSYTIDTKAPAQLELCFQLSKLDRFITNNMCQRVYNNVFILVCVCVSLRA
jgi:hypothetical protein